MYDDILFPIDGSESAAETLDHVRQLASERDATVHVLYVVDDRSFLTLDDEMVDEALEELRAAGETATDAVASELEDAGLEVTTALARGDPADEILAYARERDLDLIAMGTRGDDYTENMLGSTAQTVVARAPIPVCTVRISGDRVRPIN